jgi:hypothetical protein
MARLLLQFYLYRLMKNANRVFGTGSEVKNDQLRALPRFMGFRCKRKPPAQLETVAPARFLLKPVRMRLSGTELPFRNTAKWS